jgi:chromosome segregation ATPase
MAQTLSLAANSAGIPLTGDVATLPTVITDIVVERDVANARADKAERERDELLKRPAKETAQLLIQAVEAQCKETAAVAKDRDEARAQLAEAHANYARAIEVGIKTNEELVQVRETCVSAVLSQHAAIERAEAFESRVKELEDDLHVKITSNMSLNRQKELLLTKRNKLEAECGRLRETLAYVRTELPEAGENVIQMEGMSYQILVPEVVVEMVGAIKAALSPNPESGNQC